MGKEQAVVRIKELKWLRLIDNGNSLATVLFRGAEVSCIAVIVTQY